MSFLGDGWEYLAPAVITSVFPADGQIGTHVTLSGTGLRGGAANSTRIMLGELEATAIVYDTDTEVVVVSPRPEHEPKCASGTILHIGTCVTKCPSDTYPAVASDNGLRCQPCHSSCDTCSGGGADECLSCASSLLLNNKRCTSFCFDDGEALYRDGQSCSACNAACSRCVGALATDCVTCADDSLVLHERECIAECPETMFYNTEVGQCTPCMNNCKKCTSTEFCRDVYGPFRVHLLASSNAEVAKENSWSYNPTGRIDGVVPNVGQVGTKVVINGISLRGSGPAVDFVYLVEVLADIIKQEDEQVVVVAKARLGGGGSVVLVSSSGAIVSAEDAFTYADEGKVNKVDPPLGQFGTRVRLTGSALLGGGTGVSSLTLAGVGVESIGFVSSTAIDVVVAEGSAGSGAVIITSNTGAVVTEADGFAYIEKAHNIALTPNAGQQGTRIAISGVGMLQGGTSAATVTFGSVNTTIDLGSSDSLINVVVDQSGVANEVVDVVIVADTGAIATAASGYTSVAAGVVQKVNPAFGQYGTRVNISGDNLLGGGSEIVSITLASVQVETIVPGGTDELVSVVVAMTNFVGVGDVVLIADTGAITTQVGGWEYPPAGAIAKVYPPNGQFSTHVTISGSNLDAHGGKLAVVNLAGTRATIKEQSATNVVVVAAKAGAGRGPITLLSESGGLINMSEWTYLELGQIDKVDPAVGQLGSLVILSGVRLFGGGASASTITLAGVEAIINQKTATDERIEVEAAASPTNKTGDVMIVSNSGAVLTKSNAWTYRVPGNITRVEPSTGQLGTYVTIYGTDLRTVDDAVDSVTLASVAAEIIDEGLGTKLVVRAVDSDARLGTILITLKSGIRVTLENGWEYKPAGFIAAIEPAVGVANTSVVLYGVSLRGHGSEVKRVQLAGVDATILREEDQFITVLAGAADPGTKGKVVISVDSGAVITSTEDFTYVPVGNITSVSPANGIANTIVTIYGDGMLSGSTGIYSVTLAGITATIIEKVTNEKIVVRAGPDGVEGKVGHVILTTNTGVVSTLPNGFRYLAEGEIYDVSPEVGHYGTRVTITGISLLGGGELVSVTLADELAEVLDASETSIVLVVQASNTSKVGPIVIKNNEGAQVVRLIGWKYTAPAVIDSIRPSSGQVGTLVTIDGSGLLMGESGFMDSIKLSGTKATIVSFNDTRMIVEADLGTNFTQADAQIWASDGGYVRGGDWHYVAAGVIDKVTPNIGQGHTRVTVSGSGLNQGASKIDKVFLAGVAATITGQSDSSIAMFATATLDASVGDVVVLATTGARVTSHEGWTYSVPGSIESVYPSSGQAGTFVTLSGQALLGGGESVDSLTLNGVPVAAIDSRANGNRIVVVVAKGPAGTGAIRITSNTGALVVLEDGFKSEGEFDY